MHVRTVLSAQNVGGVSLGAVGTVLRLERDAWSTVRRLAVGQMTEAIHK